jgi:putative transposase
LGKRYRNGFIVIKKSSAMYDSDVKDEEWELIKHYFNKRDKRGTKPIHQRRDIVNAIFYVAKTGIQWRMLPKEFAPWGTVYDYYRQWNRSGVWSEALHNLNKLHRKKMVKTKHQAMA